jgi:hypothetical protein
MGWRNAFAAAALLILAFVASATAAPPTNVAATEHGGRLTVTWDLALNSLSSAVEIAHSSKTSSNGSFSDPGKLTASVDESETTYTSALLSNGAWYVHVASYDPTSPKCTFNGDLKCPTEWSPVVTATIGSEAGGGGAGASFTLLSVAPKQKAGKLQVKAAISTNGTITAGGTVNVPNAAKVYKLKSVSVGATAGKAVTLKMRLAKKALKAVRKALKRKKQVKARLTITARDAAGNTKTEKRTVRLTG